MDVEDDEGLLLLPVQKRSCPWTRDLAAYLSVPPPPKRRSRRRSIGVVGPAEVRESESKEELLNLENDVAEVPASDVQKESIVRALEVDRIESVVSESKEEIIKSQAEDASHLTEENNHSSTNKQDGILEISSSLADIQSSGVNREVSPEVLITQVSAPTAESTENLISRNHSELDSKIDITEEISPSIQSLRHSDLEADHMELRAQASNAVDPLSENERRTVSEFDQDNSDLDIVLAKNSDIAMHIKPIMGDIYIKAHARNPPAPFLLKLWNILNDPASKSIIEWRADFNSFEIFDKKRLEQVVLARNFKQKSWHYFKRQLNSYGFRSISKEDMIYEHPCFHKLHHERLGRILRKPPSVSRKRQSKSLEKSISMEDDQSFSGLSVSDQSSVGCLQSGSSNFDNRCLIIPDPSTRHKKRRTGELEGILQKQRGLEEKIKSLELLNSGLSQEVEKNRVDNNQTLKRLDEILQHVQVLAQAIIGSSGSNLAQTPSSYKSKSQPATPSEGSNLTIPLNGQIKYSEDNTQNLSQRENDFHRELPFAAGHDSVDRNMKTSSRSSSSTSHSNVGDHASTSHSISANATAIVNGVAIHSEFLEKDSSVAQNESKQQDQRAVSESKVFVHNTANGFLRNSEHGVVLVPGTVSCNSSNDRKRGVVCMSSNDNAFSYEYDFCENDEDEDDDSRGIPGTFESALNLSRHYLGLQSPHLSSFPPQDISRAPSGQRSTHNYAEFSPDRMLSSSENGFGF